MLITDKLFLSYQRCDRRGFLEVCGDASQLDPPSDFLIKLLRDSWTYQQTILDQQTYQQPYFPKGDWVAGAEATFALMQRGVDRIFRGVLLLDGDNPIGGDSKDRDRVLHLDRMTFLSRPHLLIKQPGFSKFGNWVYSPADIWLSKRPKLDYQIIAAFHAQMLAQIQGTRPDTAWLILREKGPYTVNLTQRIPQMQQELERYITILQEQKEPEVFIARQKCSLCTWYTSCYAIAQSQRHLSLLPGVTPSRYAKLHTLNLTTLESLATATSDRLGAYPEFADGVGLQLVQQAQSVLENRAFLRGQPGNQDWQKWHDVASPSHPGDGLNPQSIPPIELYFDIEAEPELELDYLHGVLVVDRRSNTETFHALLAEKPTDEATIWQKFLDLVWSYPIAPIFHFCDYEAQTIKRLAKRYNTPAYQWQPILKRLVDIHKQVTQTVTLPVESYALKPIARWMGFEWRDPKANGAQCVCWYDEWLKTGDRAFLDAIVRYNEDDCRATYHVKDWLARFMQNV